MKIMTTTSAPFREADVARDVAGKFTGKDQSAPELTLSTDDFDLATFMQEPPATPEPFAVLQPVVYTNVDGEDVYGTIESINIVEDTTYLTLRDRVRGTLSETGDDTLIVDARYARPDDEVSLDAVRRQAAGLAAATESARELSKLPDIEVTGVDNYLNSLHVRDALEVDGRKDWADSYLVARNDAERALDDLVHRDLLTWEAASWVNLEGGAGCPQEFDDMSNAFDAEGWVVARAAVAGKMLDSYGPWAHTIDGTAKELNDATVTARALGHRIAESTGATDTIDTEVDAVGLDASDEVFGGHVRGLSQRKATAYRKAVHAADSAFGQLARYNLIDHEQKMWTTGPTDAKGDDAVLVRAAGQAAILRHYQPETGLTDEQLDTISSVFDGAVKAWAKKTA